jgi:hypothetical protein
VGPLPGTDARPTPAKWSGETTSAAPEAPPRSIPPAMASASVSRTAWEPPRLAPCGSIRFLPPRWATLSEFGAALVCFCAHAAPGPGRVQAAAWSSHAPAPSPRTPAGVAGDSRLRHLQRPATFLSEAVKALEAVGGLQKRPPAEPPSSTWADDGIAGAGGARPARPTQRPPPRRCRGESRKGAGNYFPTRRF